MLLESVGRYGNQMEWGDYEWYRRGVEGKLSDAPRPVARAAFDRLMEAKSERIQMLIDLAGTQGFHVDSTDGGVQRLNDWFCAFVEEDPESMGRMKDGWYSVGTDIGLFLGETAIQRHPDLHWEFFTWGKRNISYHRAVIMGFSTDNPKFHINFDPADYVVGYGHRLVKGIEEKTDAFVHWLEVIDKRASDNWRELLMNADEP